MTVKFPEPFSGTCRNCGHEIEQTIKRTEQDNYPGVHIRCAKCRTISWVTEDE